MVLVVAPMTAFWFPRCWVLHTELYISNRHTEIFETINAQKQFSLSCRAKTKMASRMLVTKSGGTSELLLGTKLFEFLQVKLDELLSWDLYSRLQSCSHWGTISMFSTVSIVLLIPDHKAGLHEGAFKSLLKRPITVQVSEVGWCKNPASLLTSDLICDLTISPVIVVVSIWRTCGVMALSRKECEVVQILSTLFCFVFNLFLCPWVFYTIFLELNRKTLGTREHTPGDSLSRDEYCHRFL